MYIDVLALDGPQLDLGGALIKFFEWAVDGESAPMAPQRSNSASMSRTTSAYGGGSGVEGGGGGMRDLGDD